MYWNGLFYMLKTLNNPFSFDDQHENEKYNLFRKSSRFAFVGPDVIYSTRFIDESEGHHVALNYTFRYFNIGTGAIRFISTRVLVCIRRIESNLLPRKWIICSVLRSQTTTTGYNNNHKKCDPALCIAFQRLSAF